MSVRIAFFCVILLCGPSAHAESKSIFVDDPRPVAKAVEQLEAIYGVVITYEDPVYVHQSEIKDVTAQVRRDGKSFPKVLVPRGGTFSFTYDTPSEAGIAEGSNVPTQSSLLQKALDGANNAVQGFDALHNAHMFKVVQDNNSLHVVPLLFVNPSGQLEEIHPILDTSVSIGPGKRTMYEFLTEMFRSLSASSGYKIGFGTTPENLLFRHTTTITATNEPARSVLSRLLAETYALFGSPISRKVPLSWRLLYGPGPNDNSYVLNIHPVIPVSNAHS